MMILHLRPRCLNAIVGSELTTKKHVSSVRQDWCRADCPLCRGGSHSEAASLDRGGSLQVAAPVVLTSEPHMYGNPF